jgi:hypothetical protein
VAINTDAELVAAAHAGWPAAILGTAAFDDTLLYNVAGYYLDDGAGADIHHLVGTLTMTLVGELDQDAYLIESGTGSPLIRFGAVTRRWDDEHATLRWRTGPARIQ